MARRQGKQILKTFRKGGGQEILLLVHHVHKSGSLWRGAGQMAPLHPFLLPGLWPSLSYRLKLLFRILLNSVGQKYVTRSSRSFTELERLCRRWGGKGRGEGRWSSSVGVDRV